MLRAVDRLDEISFQVRAKNGLTEESREF